MGKVFQFKQFCVDQTHCGMKVNTDAALLGALAEMHHPRRILEIGTGTGVIALMIAQRYPESTIDAVEIDESAAKTAGLNFKNSPFGDRINLVASSFEKYFETMPGKKYDLIVSNPPYFINALKSHEAAKNLARHTDVSFFEDLISGSAQHLSQQGLIYLILPLDTAQLVVKISAERGNLSVRKQILIHSFPVSEPYRCILVLGFERSEPEHRNFIIYDAQNVYSDEYRILLKDYLTIF
ncbi:MAG: tRNA1(Val) (adenine(37)-N6)-methyltransferase [Daejeonella sp.]